MLTLSQRDGRWSEKTLGKSKYTIGRYGCTTTCLSMASDYYGIYNDPGVMAKTFEYTKDGLILWESLPKVGIKLLERGYGRDDAKIKAALKHLDTCVILQVQGNHWVLATKARLFGGYDIADPWYGDRATTSRYNQQITGFAVIAKA